ncbi:hypothetical protein BD413DRAFT_228646 [Trametes elegans]|nr:hypothetical protein BD413DRAFT_228646 [Trametes elegans]
MSLVLKHAPTGYASQHPSLPASWSGSLDSTLGAWLICTLAGCILYGVLMYLACLYLRRYHNKDPAYLKIWVFVVILLQTLEILFCAHSSYFYLVINLNNPSIFDSPPVWSMSSVSITAPIIVTLCEGLFVRRVYLFVPQLRAVVAVSILMLGGFLGKFPGSCRDPHPVHSPRPCRMLPR